MSPRTMAGTRARDASKASSASVLPPPRTTVVARRPASSGAHVPVIRCPECDYREPGGYIGNQTGEVVAASSHHYRDSNGYLYCPACFVVWNSLPVGREASLDNVHTTPAADPYTRLNATPSWMPTEGGSHMRNLHRIQRSVNASFALVATGHEALRRAGDRVRDADVVCNVLGLPADVRDAVAYHIGFVSARVRYLTLAYGVRGEAFTLATVALVAERFNVNIAHDDLLGTMRFRDGSVVSAREYGRAYNALRSWYEENLWRDTHNTEE